MSGFFQYNYWGQCDELSCQAGCVVYLHLMFAFKVVIEIQNVISIKITVFFKTFVEI